MVVVYRAIGEAEAEVIHGLLDSFGIPSMLQSNTAPSVHMFTDNIVGKVEVMVWASRVEEARHLLAQTSSGEVVEDKTDIE
jgi:hypothetical protein